MQCRVVLLLLLLDACYSPLPQLGNPCDEQHPCPMPLVCAVGRVALDPQPTCQQTASLPDATPDAAPDAGCVPTAEICGDGIDQDCRDGDLACEVNDKPADAIDVTGGGAFMADLLRAHDDLSNAGCNGDGGNDVFYQVMLGNPEVYYFDTFGSSFDTSIRVFPGVPCTSVAGASDPACDDDACGGDASQLALELPAGASCVVVDKNENASVEVDQGALQLHVVPGGRTGMELPRGVATLSGDTCHGVDASHPQRTHKVGDDDDCAAPGSATPDLAYFFTACPGQPTLIDASTCADPTKTHFDTVLYIHPVGGDYLACEDDDHHHICGPRPDRPDQAPDGSILTAVAIQTAGLYWLVVDGSNPSNGIALQCGPYQLDTNYR